MTHDISQTEASLALGAVQQRRQEVLAEIDVPRWYWPGMATGWVGLGLLADFGPPWGSAVATVVFGAVHGIVARRALTGRHASAQVSIRRDLVWHWIPAVVVAFLMAMVALTVGIALLFDADGAGHPASLAGGVVAVIVLATGPHLMRAVRRYAQRRSRG